MDVWICLAYWGEGGGGVYISVGLALPPNYSEYLLLAITTTTTILL